MKYYSAVRRNEILTRATTWMSLETMQNESRFHLYEIPEIGKPIATKIGLVFSRAIGKGELAETA